MSDDRTGHDGEPRETHGSQEDAAPESARDAAAAGAAGSVPEGDDASADAVDEAAHDDAVTDDAAHDDAATDDAAPVDLATDVTATDREAAANEAAERARALQPRTVGLWGVRAAAGIATIAVGVLAVLAGPSLPATTAEPRAQSVVPTAPIESRVCAGPLLGVGDASGDAGIVRVLADPQLVTSTDERADVALDGVEGSLVALRGADVAGAESLAVASDAAFGAAASECVAPSTSQWLVGGATTTGRSSVLTIANPGRASTSVDVRIFGTEGEVDAVGSTGIAIAPASTAVLDLAALAPGVASPVVHVASSGGPVAAHLQHTVVRTLQPGGVDVADPTQAATSVAIAGLEIGEATGVQTQEGFADATPALRLLAAESTQVTITTIADGSQPIASTLDLEGGQVQEVDLGGLAPGTYALRIDADVPIVAGARHVRIDGDRVDLDWIAAATQPLAGATTVAVPQGQDPRIHVLNIGDEATTVAVGGQSFELAPNGLRSLPAQAGIATIEGEGVVAAVTTSGPDGIAGSSITPPLAARSGIDVVL
ncbi:MULTISPECIES: DUF5719 family protein [unclassified Agrococcus]|uniref:DUF5719 family protein n=1 Tax=unclassified Agrococcus TaxID=2615065 RepID=UPI00361D179C